MKKFREFMDNWEERFESWWLSLPRKKQRLIVISFFLCYATGTALALDHAWNEGKRNSEHIRAGRIANPLLPMKKEPIGRIPVADSALAGTVGKQTDR